MADKKGYELMSPPNISNLINLMNKSRNISKQKHPRPLVISNKDHVYTFRKSLATRDSSQISNITRGRAM